MSRCPALPVAPPCWLHAALPCPSRRPASRALPCLARRATLPVALTPLPALVPIRLAGPSGGPILARSSTVLPCPAVPSGSLSGLHLPLFSTNLVSTAALQDAMVTTTTPGGVRIRSDSSPLLLSHQTLLWHHCLGHPSLPCLRGMHSRLLVSGLPRSLPPLPPSPVPPCLPCIEGRQSATPHSSFPPTIAPLQTLHMDLWGPSHINGQDHKHYFLLVVDDYTRYTTVFPLRSKGEVPDVLIPWIRAVCLQLRERFCEDLPVLRLHSDRGGKFSSDLLGDFCPGEGILQPFTLPASPQKNGVDERHIGLVMEVARTSMTHAVAPLFLWSFAFRYAAHQLNLWPRVSLPETSPTLCWMGKVGDASFCHPASHCDLSSHDVKFDESVPFLRLFPYRTAPLPPPPPVFLAPGPPPVDPLPPSCPAPSGVSQVDPLPLAEPVQLIVDLGAARGAASGGAEPASAEPGFAEPAGAEPGGAEPEGAESGGAEPRGTASVGGPAGASPRQSHRREPLSPQQLREWFSWHTRLRSGTAGAGGPDTGGTGAGGAVATSLGGARVTAGPGGTGAGGVGDAGTGDPGAGGIGAGGTGAGGAGARGARAGNPRTGGAGAGRTGAGGAGAGGLGAGDCGAGGTGAGDPRAGGAGAGAGDLGAGGLGAGGPGAGGAGAGDPRAEGAGTGGAGAGSTGAGGTVQRRPFFVAPPPLSLPPPGSVLRQVLRLPSSTGLTPSLLCPPPHQTQPQFQLDSPLPAPSPYLERTDSLTECREPESRPAWHVRDVHTGRRIPRPRPPPVPGTHIYGTLSFLCSTADPSLFLRTDTSLPPFYILLYVEDLVFATADTKLLALVKSELQKRHTCTDLAPPSDESIEPSGPYRELVGCLITLGMGLVLGGWGPVVLTGHADASWVDDLATQWSSQGYNFSLGSGSVPWRSTRSSSVLISSCKAEIYTGAMAAQELRWLTYLLTDLGERPRSPPVLDVDNKAIIALCQEHRLEHRAKHIALRYFLAREL
ncbi:unnamed protein product [Closterium sp. NIES-53]